MKTMNADLQTRRGLPPGLKILLAVAALGTGYELVQALSLRAEIATLRESAQQLRPAGQRVGAAQPGAGDPLQQQALAQIRSELLMPWEPVLDAVAENAGTAIALRSVRPDPLAQQAEVSGVARTRDDFLDYVERLRRDRRLRDAEPQGDEPGNTPRDAGVLFRLRVSWSATP